METTNHQTSSDVHILLTSLGTTLFDKPTEYEWDGKKAKAYLAPLALVKLLDPSQQPNHAFAMVTARAKGTTWPAFREGIHTALGRYPEIIPIPDGSSSGEVHDILEKVAEEIPEGATLTLDVTQGMRHFPFIFYALALYLTSLRGVKIRGAYYGMFEAPGKAKPIIDLQPLLELPEWFHAVRMFRDQGTTKPIAQLLEPLSEQLRREGDELREGTKTLPDEAKKRYRQANQVKQADPNKHPGSVDWLERYAFAYESALPLELEKASKGLSDSIKKLPTIGGTGLPPLVNELTGAIVAAADKSAFPKPPSGGGDWKSKIPLDEDELKRQSYMIDLYLERVQLSLAVGLMREWVVSWAIWQSGNTDDINDWLNRDVRSLYERRLGAIGAFAANTAFKSTITNEQKTFAGFWDRLGDELRNALHHHAMRTNAFEQSPSFLKDVRDFWNGLRAGDTKLPILGGGEGKLLISPQGERPGVLFSAIKAAGPNACLVICSKTSADYIPEAAKHASFKGDIKQIELADPSGGFDEINKAAEQAKDYLLSADEVHANITGGSTLMGVIVQRLVEDAQKLDRPVKRFALIDRRPRNEQDSNPFEPGKSHWLD